MAAIQVSRWNDLNDLYARACGLDSAELGVLLIELALARHPLLPALHRLLDAPAAGPMGEAFAPPARSAALYTFHRLPRPSQPARRIGTYRLLTSLASNSAGETWLGRRVDEATPPAGALGTADGCVIVKRLAPHHRRPEPAAAFSHRAAALRRGLATLRPLGLRTVADAGIGADGHPWLALVPVEGEPITLHCDRLRMPLAARLQLLRRMLVALAQAHAKGLVHGDLNPANVLVGADGGLRICAFGIAALEREWAGARPLPDAADDAHALGRLLYELLCGRPALPPTGSMVAGVVTRLGPLRPSRQPPDADLAAARGLSAAALREALQGRLDALAMRAVGATGAAFGDAAQLLAAVECQLAGPCSRALNAAPWWHRSRR